MVKNLPAIQETLVQSLGWEDPLKEEMAIHSSILAWKISMDRGTWRIRSMGSRGVSHGFVTEKRQLQMDLAYIVA